MAENYETPLMSAEQFFVSTNEDISVSEVEFLTVWAEKITNQKPFAGWGQITNVNQKVRLAKLARKYAGYMHRWADYHEKVEGCAVSDN